MTSDVHHKFSSHLCSKCGGPAPHWQCPGCGLNSLVYDPRHFASCAEGGKMQAKCEQCNLAESKCTCV